MSSVLKYILIKDIEKSKFSFSYPGSPKTFFPVSKIEKMIKSGAYTVRGVIRIKKELLFYYTLQTASAKAFIIILADENYSVETVLNIIYEIENYLKDKSSINLNDKTYFKNLFSKNTPDPNTSPDRIKEAKCFEKFQSFQIQSEAKKKNKNAKKEKSPGGKEETFIELCEIQEDEMNKEERDPEESEPFSDEKLPVKKSRLIVFSSNQYVLKSKVVKWKNTKIVMTIICSILTLFFIIIIPFFMLHIRQQ